jgi:hypothetical protein
MVPMLGRFPARHRSSGAFFFGGSLAVSSQRLFMLGVVLLLVGIQFRLVNTFVLNEKASQFVEKRLGRSPAAGPYTTQNTSLDPLDSPYDSAWLENGSAPPVVNQQSFSPPRWLGLSLISVGAVLILTHPCYRS